MFQVFQAFALLKSTHLSLQDSLTKVALWRSFTSKLLMKNSKIVQFLFLTVLERNIPQKVYWLVSNTKQ